jgi:hypothetical protein
VTIVTIRIPVPRDAGALSNLLGVLGLVAIVAGAGGLTRNPWVSVVAAGLILCGLSYIAARHDEAARPRPGPTPVGSSQPGAANIHGRRGA